MSLDLHWLVNILLAMVSAGLGWFCREIWSAVQKLRADLQAFELRISNEYVRYDRLQDALRPVLDKLQRIEDALTHKVDK